jgi:hypothetical protein
MNRRIRSRTYGGVRGRGLKGPLLLDCGCIKIYEHFIALPLGKIGQREPLMVWEKRPNYRAKPASTQLI